jgi:hypothetical protein
VDNRRQPRRHGFRRVLLGRRGGAGRQGGARRRRLRDSRGEHRRRPPEPRPPAVHPTLRQDGAGEGPSHRPPSRGAPRRRGGGRAVRRGHAVGPPHSRIDVAVGPLHRRLDSGRRLQGLLRRDGRRLCRKDRPPRGHAPSRRLRRRRRDSGSPHDGLRPVEGRPRTSRGTGEPSSPPASATTRSTSPSPLPHRSA